MMSREVLLDVTNSDRGGVGLAEKGYSKAGELPQRGRDGTVTFEDHRDPLDQACQVARLTWVPCTNLTAGDLAEKFLQQFAADSGCFDKGVAIVEELKADAQPDEAKYYGYCIAAKEFLEDPGANLQVYDDYDASFSSTCYTGAQSMCDESREKIDYDASFSSQSDDEMMAAADDEDDSDPQRVSEYAADIYGKLGRDEASRRHGAPHPSYMKAQPDLDASARASTVDWLVGVQMKYKLKTETLFLAVSILDRFLATRRVRHKDLQLVSCTAAFIAAKFEEIHPPEVRDFVYIADQGCRKEAILGMEVTMLTALEFCLCRPTAAHYLQRYQRESHCNKAYTSLLQYILELALLDLGMMRFSPSLQAAAASVVSSRILNLNSVMPGRNTHTDSVVQRCAEEMCALLRDAERSSGEVRRKFSRPEFHSVATNTCIGMDHQGSTIHPI